MSFSSFWSSLLNEQKSNEKKVPKGAAEICHFADVYPNDSR